MKCLKINDNLILIRQEKNSENESNYDIYITKADSHYLVEFYKFTGKEISINKMNLLEHYKYSNKQIDIYKKDIVFDEFYNFFSFLPRKVCNFGKTLIPDFYCSNNEDKVGSDSLTILYDEQNNKLTFNTATPYYPFCINRLIFSEYLNAFDNLFESLLQKSVPITDEDCIEKNGILYQKLVDNPRLINNASLKVLTRKYIYDKDNN